MSRLFLTVSLGWFLVVPAFAQTPKALTNDDVVKMVKAGLQESLIIKAIESSPSAFDTSVPRILALKKDEGVPDNVIEAMIAVQAKSKTSTAPSSDSTPRLITSAVDRGDQSSSRSNPPAIYVEEVSSTGGIMASSDTTLEAIKTLTKKGMHVVTIRDKADYVLQITRQLGKKSWKKDTKVALVNRAGEVVYANSTRSIGGGVGDVVDFIRKPKE